ncbi:MAG: AAA family ATPase [Chloroflexota bacterium]
MKPVVVLAAKDEAMEQFERAGITVIRAVGAEDAVRIAAATDSAAVVLDRQFCGSLELVAAVSQLTMDSDRRVLVIDSGGGPDGDELTQALRRRARVAVCQGGDDAVAAVRRQGSHRQSSPEAKLAAAAPGRSGSGDSLASGQRAVAVLQPQVLPVVSAKGGVGKTTVAVNLAAVLAATGLARVALADLSLTNSDIGVYLDLPEGPGLTEVIAAPERVADIACPAGTSLRVLTGLSRPEDGETIERQHIATVLAGLRKQYEIVVLDLASDPTSDILYHCVDESSAVILVSTLDAASLRDTRLLLNVLKRLNVKVADRVRLVINRVRSDSTMDPARAEEFLGIRAVCVIPDDPRSMDAAAYAGQPLALARPNHPASHAFWQLAAAISPAFERPVETRIRGLWRRSRS